MSLAGDLDLVVGEWGGLLNYIENTGTSTAPVFVLRTGSANPFDGIDVGSLSAPAFSDIDNDGTLRPRPSIDRNFSPHFRVLSGDLDLVMGESDGSLNYIENNGTSTAPVFVQRIGSANPFAGINVVEGSVPALGDFDNDGMLRPCPSIDRLSSSVASSLRRFAHGRRHFSETKVPQATDDDDAAPEQIVVTPHGA